MILDLPSVELLPPGRLFFLHDADLGVDPVLIAPQLRKDAQRPTCQIGPLLLIEFFNRHWITSYIWLWDLLYRITSRSGSVQKLIIIATS